MNERVQDSIGQRVGSPVAGAARQFSTGQLTDERRRAHLAAIFDLLEEMATF